MKRAATLLALAVFGGLGLGWFTGQIPLPQDGDASSVSAIAPVHGGSFAGRAAELLAAQGLGSATEENAEPAPTPPDIAIRFRYDLTAIERRHDGAVVAWIVDLDSLSGRRALGSGDEYREGWRVGAVSEQFVELRKRREVRRVNVTEAPVETLP